jgi:hypothetical protein
VRLVCLLLLAGCAPTTISGHASSPRVLATQTIETAPEEPARLVPPEVLLRTWVRLFGTDQPLEAEKRARGGDGKKTFDTWNDYLSTLGFPDYRNDLPRANETNALMVATFERLAEALCDRALERELRAKLPMAQRMVYAFEVPAQPLDHASFDTRFDVLHREMLGYPAALASGRSDKFFGLYRTVVDRHTKVKEGRLSPSEAGLVAVCTALARHPELHLY